MWEWKESIGGLSSGSRLNTAHPAAVRCGAGSSAKCSNNASAVERNIHNRSTKTHLPKSLGQVLNTAVYQLNYGLVTHLLQVAKCSHDAPAAVGFEILQLL